MACIKSLAELFPDDLEDNIKEMNKIASGFLNHAVDATSGVAQDKIKEELSIIFSIIQAGECSACEGDFTPIEVTNPPVMASNADDASATQTLQVFNNDHLSYPEDYKNKMFVDIADASLSEELQVGFDVETTKDEHGEYNMAL